MELIQDDTNEKSLSSCSSDTDVIFGDQQVLPRVGDEYQAEIPTLIPECDRLKLMALPRSSKLMTNNHYHHLLGLPIPLMWLKTDTGSIKGILEFENNEESQIISDGRSKRLKVEPFCPLLGYEKASELHMDLQSPAGGMKMESGSVLSPVSETNLDQFEKGYGPFPGSLGELWTDTEHDGFVLGLYIFGKNLTLVKRFVGSKDMGDILSFYYGKFYRSTEYRRWSEFRKQRRKRTICGQKIFQGWRQQELLSRLFSCVSQECQSVLLELSRSFGAGKFSFEEYIFSLKSSVGINVLIEAVAIGKGKKDLTGFCMEPIKPKHLPSVHPEKPVGKAYSSLSSEEIIRFLTGNFRISKARSNDLFWEAVWPRLLARGWHSEQPKNVTSGSKHSLVFIIPGVKKFSTRLVKRNHYFDSVTDVLNKVAAEPRLLELEVDSVYSSQSKENGYNSQSKQGQDSVLDKQRRCLQHRNPNSTRKVEKFTIVDTSLPHAGEHPMVREFRSLPYETASESSSSNFSSESEENSSEEELEEDRASNSADDVIDRTCTDPSDYVNSPPDGSMASALDPATVPVENHENQGICLVDDQQRTNFGKYQFSLKGKDGSSKYMIPITKHEGFAAHDQGDTSCSTERVFANRKVNEGELRSTSKSVDAVEDMFFQPCPFSNSSRGAMDSRDGCIDHTFGENYLGREVSSEKPPCHVSPAIVADGSIMTCTEQNEESARIENSSSECETSLQTDPLKLIDACSKAPQKVELKAEPLLNGRRQSSRNRSMTTKALEAIELGIFSTTKRKFDNYNPGRKSRTPGRVRRKTVKLNSTDVAGNNAADTRTQSSLDTSENTNEMVCQP